MSLIAIPKPKKAAMTLRQLSYLSNRFLDKGISPDTQVLITTADKRVGARDAVKATGLYMGFDLEAGQLRIETDEPIKKVFQNGRIKIFFELMQIR